MAVSSLTAGLRASWFRCCVIMGHLCWHCQDKLFERKVHYNIYDLDELLDYLLDGSRRKGEVNFRKKEVASAIRILTSSGELVFEGDASNSDKWSDVGVLRLSLYAITRVHPQGLLLMSSSGDVIVEPNNAYYNPHQKIYADTEDGVATLFIHFGKNTVSPPITPLRAGLPRSLRSIPAPVKQELICNTCRGQIETVIQIWICICEDYRS